MRRKREIIERERERQRREKETHSAVIIRHNQNVLMQFFANSVCHLIKGTFAINTFSIWTNDRYTLTKTTSLYTSFVHCTFLCFNLVATQSFETSCTQLLNINGPLLFRYPILFQNPMFEVLTKNKVPDDFIELLRYISNCLKLKYTTAMWPSSGNVQKNLIRAKIPATIRMVFLTNRWYSRENR